MLRHLRSVKSKYKVRTVKKFFDCLELYRTVICVNHTAHVNPGNIYIQLKVKTALNSNMMRQLCLCFRLHHHSPKRPGCKTCCTELNATFQSMWFTILHYTVFPSSTPQSKRARLQNMLYWIECHISINVIHYIEGWWLSGCRSSVAEHWLHKPGVDSRRLPAFSLPCIFASKNI